MQKHKLITAFVLAAFIIGANTTNGATWGRKIKGIMTAGFTKGAEKTAEKVAEKTIFNPVADKISDFTKPVMSKIFPKYFKKKKLQEMLAVYKAQAEALAALKTAGAKGKKYSQDLAKVQADLHNLINPDKPKGKK